MKKLFLIFVIVLSGCSVAENQQEEFDLFSEYYQECVDYCNADNDWLDACGHPKFDVDSCAKQAWNDGCDNWWCSEQIEFIEEYDYALKIASGLRDEVCGHYDNRGSPFRLPPTESYCR